ncbi:succinate--hydroxymethylglutarate CoA-transferase [Leptopilina boulardi]|uniref:succinate--hydroxymethylglutarate CoA-transferase n=1 Tax=Leptopilina boulardi TaxID=63433 RepID=UPI0021F61F3E|nr:succinate--hydroxymethylglutarate CoA-transferase [Leptopilina boulardi]
MAKVIISRDKCLLRSLYQIPRGKYYSTNVNDVRSPLSGIRVMDLTRVVAGPYCTMLLGDLGAEILKIEEPGIGDQTRQWGPFFGNSKKATAYFVSLNRNKKSICIDLKRGKEIIYDLAKKSDVLMENYVPGKLSKYGLSYEEIHKIAPHLVYCSLTGYGYKGPYRNRPGYDVIAASYGGLLDMTGPENGPPCRPGVALTDISTGLYAHGAIMAALIQRTKTNEGQWIQCDLLSTQIANLINIGSAYLNGNQESRKWGSALDSIVPYEAFKTKNGWFTVGTGSDGQYRDLINRMNLQQLNDKYETNAIRVKKRDELVAILKSVFLKKTNDEWSEIFEGASFPYAPVNNMKNTFNDKHIKEIGIVKEVEIPEEGTVKIVGPAVTYSDSKNEIRSPPPKLGQNTIEVMRDILQYPEDSIKNLLKNGVIQ